MKTNAFDSNALGQSIAMLIWAEIPAEKKQALAQRIRDRKTKQAINQVKEGEAA